MENPADRPYLLAMGLEPKLCPLAQLATVLFFLQSYLGSLSRVLCSLGLVTEACLIVAE
jgi:hypothetical protein